MYTRNINKSKTRKGKRKLNPPRKPKTSLAIARRPNVSNSTATAFEKTKPVGPAATAQAAIILKKMKFRGTMSCSRSWRGTLKPLSPN